MAGIAAFARHFGVLSMDRFATAANAVCPKFTSYFRELGCTGVDAFAQEDGLVGLNFVKPPFSQLSRMVSLGMVPFGDRASDPASTRPRVRDRVHWTQLDRPEQWASDPSIWASDPSVDKLRYNKRKNKP